jgi:hypothetical protein
MTTTTYEYRGNAGRAADAEVALDAFVRTQEPRARDLDSAISQSPQEFLVDLLTDLRHWASQNSVDFDGADRLAAGHFQCELNEEAHEPMKEITQ